MPKGLVPTELRNIVAALMRAGKTPADVERITEGTVTASLAERLFKSIKAHA